VLAPQWHLTYGQSAVILYSGGVGAILGALVFGGLSDAWGRKITMIIGTFICAASSGIDGHRSERLVGDLRSAALFFRGRADSRGHAFLGDSGRACTDAAPDPACELLSGFRVGFMTWRCWLQRKGSTS
jgi:hypothetical protein